MGSELSAYKNSSNNEIAENFQKFLDSLPIEKIPETFKKENDDNSHWCCKIETPVTNYEQTRIVTRYETHAETYKCGWSNCGFLGMHKCTRYCKRYISVMVYAMEKYLVYRKEPCPTDMLTCCKDHFLIVGHCYHLLEIHGNVDLLQQANELGIVIPPLNIG